MKIWAMFIKSIIQFPLLNQINSNFIFQVITQFIMMKNYYIAIEIIEYELIGKFIYVGILKSK